MKDLLNAFGSLCVAIVSYFLANSMTAAIIAFLIIYTGVSILDAIEEINNKLDKK